MSTIKSEATTKITKHRVTVNKTTNNIKWNDETTQWIQKAAKKEEKQRKDRMSRKQQENKLNSNHISNHIKCKHSKSQLKNRNSETA